MGKHTHYFATYADAYNYYPNGIPSTEIAIVGDASYVFVSSDNSYSGNTTFFDANMTNDEIVDTMNETAYNAGTTYGYEVGFDEGYDDGYDEGFADGVDSVPTPEGNIDITTTSQYDVTTYATAQIADANLTASNIKDGVTILGITGEYAGSGGIQPSGTYYITDTNQADVTNYSYAQIDVMSSNLSPVNIKYGETVLGVVGEYTGSGITPSGTYYIYDTYVNNVTDYAYAQVDTMGLLPENIKSGVTILGVTGSYSGLQPSGTMYIENTMPYDVTTYSTAQVTDMNLTAGNIANGVTILGITGTYTGGASSIDYAMANQASHYVNTTNMISISGHSFTSAMQSYYDFSTSDSIWYVISDYMQNQTSSSSLVIMADKITSNNGVEIAYLTGGEVSLTGNTITFDVNLNAGDQIGFSVLNWFFEPDMAFPDDPTMGSYVCDSFYWLTGAESGTGTSYPNGHWLTATGYSGTWEAEWNVGAGTFSFSYIGSSEQVTPEPGPMPEPDPEPTPEPDPHAGEEQCWNCGGTGMTPDPVSGEDIPCAVCGGTGWLPTTPAQPVMCPDCAGTGTITDPESGDPVMCPTCVGTGWMP